MVKIILQQVVNGGPVTLRTVTSVRDFVYRDDVASGLAALAGHTQDPGCEIFNLSSGVATSIRQLVETACRIEGIDAQIIETAPILQVRWMRYGFRFNGSRNTQGGSRSGRLKMDYT